MKRVLFTLFSLVVSTSVLADVQITFRHGDGDTSTFSSDGRMARIDDKQMPGFVLIDFARSEFFNVDSQRNEVMKAGFSGTGKAESSARVNVRLDDKGGGPKIAGYQTRKFEVFANGESCGYLYGSKKLLKNKNVRAIFDSMRKMQQFSRSMMGGMSGFLSACEQADLQLADTIESSGAPLRMVDSKGRLESEVLAVDTNKKFAGNHYKLPAGMPVVDMREKMNQANQQNQQMMENMPDMNQIMEQMQQGGGQTSDQMQQQMEKLKKMMEQLQSQ